MMSNIGLLMVLAVNVNLHIMKRLNNVSNANLDVLNVLMEPSV